MLDYPVGPKSIDKCPYKRYTEERHRDKRKGHVKTKVEPRVMQPQTKEHQECWQHQKLEEAKN